MEQLSNIAVKNSKNKIWNSRISERFKKLSCFNSYQTAVKTANKNCQIAVEQFYILEISITVIKLSCILNFAWLVEIQI